MDTPTTTSRATAGGGTATPGGALGIALAGQLVSLFGAVRPKGRPDLDRPIDPARAIAFTRWIPGHGDALIDKLVERCPQIDLVDAKLFPGSADKRWRGLIAWEAEYDPAGFHRRIAPRLAALKAAGLRALLLTLDWYPPMRELAFAARAAGLSTVLVPHESVFSTTESYYTYAPRGPVPPVSDRLLVWGGVQERIFSSRGYPMARIRRVGSPKLDADVAHRPLLDRTAVRRRYGLPPDGPLVLAALQPLDNFPDADAARAAQAAALAGVLDHAEARGLSVLVRTPPSHHVVVPAPLAARIAAGPRFAIDGPGPDRLPPEEALIQADLVVSPNSTMLLEARLMGRPAIALTGLAVEIDWARAGVVRAATDGAYADAADAAIAAGAAPMSAAELAWAVDCFSDPAFGFDGRSFDRIGTAIADTLREPPEPLRVALPDSGDAAALRVGTVALSPRLAERVGGSGRFGGARFVVARTAFAMAAADLAADDAAEPDRSFQALRMRLGRPGVMIDLSPGTGTGRR